MRHSARRSGSMPRASAQQVEDETSEVQPGKMFMKKAYFFTASQVDALAMA